MVTKPTSPLDTQAADYRRQVTASGAGSTSHGSRVRERIYLVLLIFVVVVGLPIIGIPGLRSRVSQRVHALREASDPFSFKPTPAWTKVGENRYPFPAEFEKPVVPRPEFSSVIDLTHRVFRGGGEVQTRELSSPETSKGTREASRDSDVSGAAPEPEFRQGKSEQEGYDLLLKSQERVAGLVKGTNPSLRFKTWAAAKTDQDTYLVDLTFIQVSDSAEVHYIWRVCLLSKEITALSHNARALSKS